MKTLLLTTALTFGLSSYASPPPQQQQDDQDQQQQDQQGCRPENCRPTPRVYVCHAQMIDCYGRPLYTYWGRGPNYQGSCHFAANLCLSDSQHGYGGYGSRCVILGK